MVLSAFTTRAAIADWSRPPRHVGLPAKSIKGELSPTVDPVCDVRQRLLAERVLAGRTTYSPPTTKIATSPGCGLGERGEPHHRVLKAGGASSPSRTAEGGPGAPVPRDDVVTRSERRFGFDRRRRAPRTAIRMTPPFRCAQLRDGTPALIEMVDSALVRASALGTMGVLAALALSACGTSGPQGPSPAINSPSTSTSTTRPATSTTLGPRNLPLDGVVVGLDPGHNGDNWHDPTFIDRLIWNGTATEACDTTGTATNDGYTEAQFNWNVATDARNELEELGARVILTRPSNTGVGPCVTTRALLLDRANVDVAFDIHADGGPPSGRGFAILVPVRDGTNDHVITPSLRLAHDLRTTFHEVTKMPYSTYDGVDAIQLRSDLAGLNLTTVPKVLIECGNMRNATDAALLVSPAFQLLAAHALVEAVGSFLGRDLTAIPSARAPRIPGPRGSARY
jgi:N-acetylmuramoyl-L-alanine amidase